MLISVLSDLSCTSLSSLIRVYTVCNSLCILWTHYSMVSPCSNVWVITANFRVSESLGVLRYLLNCFCIPYMSMSLSNKGFTGKTGQSLYNTIFGIRRNGPCCKGIVLYRNSFTKKLQKKMMVWEPRHNHAISKILL